MHLRWGARYAFALGHPLNLSSRITVAGHRDLVTREEFVVFPSHGLSVSVVRIFGTRGGFKPQGVSKFRHRTGNIRRPSAASEMNPLGFFLVVPPGRDDADIVPWAAFGAAE
jgi:hypothetical protein